MASNFQIEHNFNNAPVSIECTSYDLFKVTINVKSYDKIFDEYKGLVTNKQNILRIEHFKTIIINTTIITTMNTLTTTNYTKHKEWFYSNNYILNNNCGQYNCP